MLQGSILVALEPEVHANVSKLVSLALQATDLFVEGQSTLMLVEGTIQVALDPQDGADITQGDSLDPQESRCAH